MIFILTWLLVFAHAQDCAPMLRAQSLRNLLERGLRSGALTPADLAPPYGADFNPFAGKTLTSQNIQLQRAFARYALPADAAATIREVLRTWSARAGQVDDARTQTAAQIAPRVMRRWPGMIFPTGNREILRVTSVKGESLAILQLSGSHGLDNFLLDVTEPARPRLKKLSGKGETVSPYEAAQIFTVPGGRRAVLLDSGKIYDLDLPEGADAKFEFTREPPPPGGSVARLHPTLPKLFAAAERNSFVEYDLTQPARDPRVVLRIPAFAEPPQLHEFNGETLLTYLDLNYSFHGKFTDGRDAFAPVDRAAFRRRRPNFFNAGATPKVMHFGYLQDSAKTVLHVINLNTGLTERSIDLDVLPDTAIELARAGPDTYALLQRRYRSSPYIPTLYVANLNTGAVKTLEVRDNLVIYSVVPMFDKTMLVWGDSEGEVAMAQLDGATQEVRRFPLGLGALTLRTFRQKQGIYALATGASGELALLQLMSGVEEP